MWHHSHYGDCEYYLTYFFLLKWLILAWFLIFSFLILSKLNKIIKLLERKKIEQAE